MAGDSTGKVTSGAPFRAPPATIWNNMIDAGRAFADGKLSSGPPGSTRSRETDLLRLKNSSGAVRRKGAILKIEGKVIETVTDESIWLDGITPTTDCRFGILKSPADEDEVVTAQVSGVCLALVNVTDASHAFASAADADYVLQSGGSGPLEILFAPDGTGELECVVRFGGNTSSGGGGSGGPGCGCCDAMDCVDPCTLTVADVVTECAECPAGATKDYFGRLASGAGWIANGRPKVTHVSGCTWESEPFNITIGELTGSYKWVFIQAGMASTWTLTSVGGACPPYDDPVQLCSASSATPVVIQYVAAETQGQAWHCLCPSKMVLATDRSIIPNGSGLRAEMCVEPMSESTPLDPALCESICYKLSVSGVSGPACILPFNGDFNLTAFVPSLPTGMNANCNCGWNASVPVTQSPAGNWLSGTPDCTCLARGVEYGVWSAGGGIAAGSLTASFGTVTGGFGGGGGASMILAYYNRVSGNPCTGDDLVYEYASSDYDTYCGAGLVTFPASLTLVRNLDCSYTRPEGCDCPGGGGGVCNDSLEWEWDGSNWFRAFPDDLCINVSCGGTCEAPAPTEPGAFVGEQVDVPCTCV